MFIKTEKLFEELLIDEKSEPTEHEKIMRAMDNGPSWSTIEGKLSDLEKAVNEERYETVKEIFLDNVNGYKPS